MAFEDLIEAGRVTGVFDLFLPFVLSFAIIYGILTKAKIFGDDKVGRTTNLIIAITLSLFVIGYTPVGITLAAFFGTMFTGTVLIVVTLLGTAMVLYVLMKIAGVDVLGDKKSDKWNAVILLLSLLLAGAAFVYSGGLSFFGGADLPGLPGISLPALPSFSISVEDAIVFGGVVLFIAAVVWMYTKEDAGKGK